MKHRAFATLIVLYIFSPTVQSVELKALFDFPVITSMALSPDGKYLAIRRFENSEHIIGVVETDGFKPVGKIKFPVGLEAGSFDWANGERLVVKLFVLEGKKSPVTYGELFAVNANGGDGVFVFGARAEALSTGTHIQNRSRSSQAWGTVVNTLPKDKKHVLVSSTPYSPSHGKPAQLRKLNVYTGKLGNQLAVTAHAYGRFFFDRQERVRMMRSLTEDRKLYVQTRVDPDGAWQVFDMGRTGGRFSPLGVNGDGEGYLAFNLKDGDRRGLFNIDFSGEEKELIYAHDRVDINGLIRSSDETAIYGVRVDDGFPSYFLFKDESNEANVFRQLLGAFPGHLIYVTSQSQDDRLWTIRTRSDVDDGTYYLFNREKGELVSLGQKRKGVNAKELAPTTPISFESFDGTNIDGYFTPPANTTRARPAPTVVLVHDGPLSRDYWEFDSEVHALSTRGFGVLRINFRGSTGYGLKFEEAGYHKWGDDIQRDILAGVDWAIKNSLMDPKNICIMGEGFGAYSAVMSASLRPDLFRCVVANGGMYDLRLMLKKGDTLDKFAGDEYLQMVLGDDSQQLERYSPINHVQSLKAPVLLVHGKDDKQTPFAHAKALRKAIRKHKKLHEWHVFRQKANSYYDVSDRVDLMERIIGFIDEHLEVNPGAATIGK
ncbi:MAG: dipeptidyl aminopeptidase/acylaminoacyl peptidase [Candidatus Azotimanducaceae bacterium]|jgi:dipeptidyl aminopeptidase/acylaminoacyl peptidase